MMSSGRLITNWIYHYEDKNSKQKLLNIHSKKFPELKQRLLLLIEQRENHSNVNLMKEILNKCDQVIRNEKTLMAAMASNYRYKQELAIDEYIHLLERDLVFNLNRLERKLEMISESEYSSYTLSSTSRQY